MAEYFIKDGESYKKVEENLLPDSTVNSIVEKRLDQQKRNQFGDYDELKSKTEKYTTDVKDLNDKLTAAISEKSEFEKQLGTAKLETDKVKIVNEFKLSEDLAEFVTGDTVDDMRKRAEKLAKGVKPSQVVIDKDEKLEGKPSDSKELAKKLFGKKSDD